MSKNVFKELQAELESKFTEEKDESLKMKVKGSVNGLMFIADIFELFITKLFSILIGKGAEHNKKK